MSSSSSSSGSGSNTPIVSATTTIKALPHLLTWPLQLLPPAPVQEVSRDLLKDDVGKARRWCWKMLSYGALNKKTVMFLNTAHEILDREIIASDGKK